MSDGGDLGSREWRENTFSGPPARDPRGRSRPTQRYLVKRPDGRTEVSEGGNEATARTILMVAENAGIVTRYKFQPFFVGREVPDILFELADGRTFVVEVKSARFLTTERVQKCLSLERSIRKGGMQYLLWTDEWPLGRATTNRARQLRRYGTSRFAHEETASLTKAIATGALTVGALRSRGIYSDVIHFCAWHGFVHFNMFEEFTDETVVGADVSLNQFRTILSARVASQSWWHSLPGSCDID